MRCSQEIWIYLTWVIKMLKRISDEIIEIAKKHENLNERMEIYWKMMARYIEWVIVDERMREYLDPNVRRSKNMKGKKNRLLHTKNKSVTDLNNKSVTDLKISVKHTKKDKAKTKGKQITDEDLTIYIANNNRLYLIVCKYIENNKQYWSISYQINKQWKEKYIYSQMKEAEKLVKEIWFKNLNDILEFISKDDFRSKQILSIAKLNRKNKEWVPYHVVIMDKMKPQKLLQERQQREIELHRQRIAEQIQSFKSEINENEQNGNQKGNYNRRQNISFS